MEAAYLGDVGFGLSEKVRMGTGAGVNYQTLVGFIRLDIAYKINPDPKDLRDPEDYFRLGDAAKTDWKRRFGLHLSIGRAF
jgi:outer membrane translocation and assembly module TamA